VDPDSDLKPAFFAIDLQDANKKQIFLQSLSAYYFLKVHLHHFSKIKSHHKEVTKQQESRFFIQFLLDDRRIWEPKPDPDPYLVLLDPDLDPGGLKTYGSGSATLV
jgi:hypothetical protein